MMQIDWRFKPFDGLSLHELYALLQLRSAVFVVEQQCAFQDLDGSDAQAHHLLGYAGGELLAYARCFDRGIKFAEASIGRVITRATVRGTGLGHVLMRECIARVCAQWGEQPIRIGAQARLERFYRSHGFATASAPYDEDGIAHIEMLWTPAMRSAKEKP
jgi:ElaA protein